jgi:hypothetical protein
MYTVCTLHSSTLKDFSGCFKGFPYGRGASSNPRSRLVRLRDRLVRLDRRSLAFRTLSRTTEAFSRGFPLRNWLARLDRRSSIIDHSYLGPFHARLRHSHAAFPYVIGWRASIADRRSSITRHLYTTETFSRGFLLRDWPARA